MPTADQRHAAQQQLRGSINHRMPPFPCNVLLYSKTETILGFKILRFSDQKTFDTARSMTVAMVRVVLTADDLADVSDNKLRYIYNQLAPEGEKLDSTEIPREELQGLVFGIIPDAATPYEDTRMSTATQPETGTPTNSTEAKAAERKAAAEKKAADKAAAKAAAAAKRADGVIGNIKAGLDSEEGTTANEMLDKLVKKFPDRTRDGMSSTVKIQFSRLAKSTGRAIHNANIVGRGRVYKFVDKGPVPGEVVTEAAAAPAAATAPAAPAAAAKAAGKGGKK